ncbi:MAG: hypothetical protein HY903_18650 [Deltaproteobacteria bacterium]|nr:hypothetical protein [Deltaproteobacteria bacterium]
MVDRETIFKLVSEVLDGTDLRLKVDAFSLRENLEDGQAEVRCDIHDQRTGERHTIDGRGVGLVDAFFNGVVAVYSGQYPSLKSIRFADFAIKATTDTGRQAARSDMAAQVTVSIANSDNREFVFSRASQSITGASLTVVLKGVEFFINSERAYIAVYQALQHARKEKRPDSVARYTEQLSVLVEATSYSEVIERLQRDKAHA